MTTLSSLPGVFFSPCFQHSKSKAEAPFASVLKFRARFEALHTASSNSGLGGVINSHWQQRWRVISASNTNPSEQDAPIEKGDGKGQGPPLLTILAGLVVFLFICWIVGSIITWLIHLVVNPRSS